MAKKMTDKDNVRVDFDRLIIKNLWDETLYSGLGLVWLVLKETTDRLRLFVEKVGSNPEDGKEAFVKDLAKARLADKKIAKLLQNLWNADRKLSMK